MHSKSLLSSTKWQPPSNVVPLSKRARSPPHTAPFRPSTSCHCPVGSPSRTSMWPPLSSSLDGHSSLSTCWLDYVNALQPPSKNAIIHQYGKTNSNRQFFFFLFYQISKIFFYFWEGNRYTKMPSLFYLYTHIHTHNINVYCILKLWGTKFLFY